MKPAGSPIDVGERKRRRVVAVGDPQRFVLLEPVDRPRAGRARTSIAAAVAAIENARKQQIDRSHAFRHLALPRDANSRRIVNDCGPARKSSLQPATALQSAKECPRTRSFLR